MIVDLRQYQSDAPLTADVMIIGSGPAGITLALELEDSGFSVAILESGGDRVDVDTQNFYAGALTGHQMTDVQWTRLRYFGGTSNHWGGHCLPFEDIDFEAKEGRPDTGWPIGRADLDPFYARAHPYCEIGEYDYSPDLLSQRKAPSLKMQDDRFTEVMMRQSKPTVFGLRYGERLAAAENITVYKWANVTEIVPREDGSSVDKLRVRTKTGKSFDATAKMFVLATGGIENARLLLNSRALSPSGLANPHGLVGKYFMDHPQGGVGYLYPQKPLKASRYFEAWDVEDDVPGYYTFRPSDEFIRKRRLPNATLWLTPLPESGAVTDEVYAGRAKGALKRFGRLNFTGAQGRGFGDDACRVVLGIDELAAQVIGQQTGIRLESGTTDRIMLRFEAEQFPDETNTVSLIEDRDALGLNRIALNWRPNEDDLDQLKEIGGAFGAAFSAAGYGRFQYEDKEGQPFYGVSTAWHHMGTTRMHDSPRKGVVDRDLKMHGLNNFYIAGSSVFPTGGRSNPTLTIVALSVRLADTLKRQGR